MEEKYLPVGTVCMLKGAKKAVMIVGFGIQPKDDQTVIYDYLGALYPEGILTMDQNMVFNHENIEKIFFKGYESPEQQNFNLSLKNAIENLVKEKGLKQGNISADLINNNDFNSQKIISVDSSIPTIQQDVPELLSGNDDRNTATYMPPFAPQFDNNDNQ